MEPEPEQQAMLAFEQRHKNRQRHFEKRGMIQLGMSMAQLGYGPPDPNWHPPKHLLRGIMRGRERPR